MLKRYSAIVIVAIVIVAIVVCSIVVVFSTFVAISERIGEMTRVVRTIRRIHGIVVRRFSVTVVRNGIVIVSVIMTTDTGSIRRVVGTEGALESVVIVAVGAAAQLRSSVGMFVAGVGRVVGEANCG